MSIKINSNLYVTTQDPRCDPSGQTFKNPLTERIRSFLVQITLRWRAYFSFSSEKRHLFRQILLCNSLEKNLSNTMQDFFINRRHKGKDRLLFAVEHDFFEACGKLFHMLHPLSNEPKRTFPSELLIPYYFNVQGQSAYQRPDQLKPGDHISDYDGVLSWSCGLPQLAYTDHPDSVDHYTFIHKINPAGDQLMKVIRDWRAFLRLESGRSSGQFSGWKEHLNCKIEGVKTAWENYQHSHPALEEASFVLAEDDYYAEFYECQKSVKTDSTLPFNKGYERLKTAILTKHQDSVAAKVFRDKQQTIANL